VITRHPATLSSRDDSRLSELPAGTRIFSFEPKDLLLDDLERWLSRATRALRSKRIAQASLNSKNDIRFESAPREAAAGSLGPASIQWKPGSLRFWMRSYWAWLDHRRQLSWANSVERVGRVVLASGRHRAVISCGPWHLCNHEAARRLARRWRLPFIMDLRDPWSLPRRIAETIATPVWFALAKHYESRAVRDASLVVLNAEPVERAMAERHHEAAGRLLTITNGYDEEDIPASRHGRRFIIGYAGGIYLDRDPRPLFQAAAQVIGERHLTPEEFGIELIGNVDDYGGVPIGRMAAEEGIGDYVRTGPLRPRREALEFLAGATMLLSLPQDSPWAIPSKIFEYMQFDAWLLVMAEADAPAAILLRDTAADVVSPSDVSALADVLRRRLDQHACGERPVRLASQTRFSRRHQAERLMTAIAECLPRRETAASGNGSPRRMSRLPIGEGIR
jgi:glycosyltransferase involved in cell wall biosynthesis